MVTTHRMRTRGLTWFRLPLFVWCIYATSNVLLLATPVRGITLVLLVVERAPPPKENFASTPVVSWEAYDHRGFVKARKQLQRDQPLNQFERQ